MKSKIMIYTAITIASLAFIFSGCSKNEEPSAIKAPTEKERNEVADKMTNRIQDPIDKARVIKTNEDARVKDQAQMIEE